MPEARACRRAPAPIQNADETAEEGRGSQVVANAEEAQPARSVRGRGADIMRALNSRLDPEAFFARVRRGEEHAKALSDTKRSFLAEGRHPSTWAPFVLHGG